MAGLHQPPVGIAHVIRVRPGVQTQHFKRIPRVAHLLPRALPLDPGRGSAPAPRKGHSPLDPSRGVFDPFPAIELSFSSQTYRVFVPSLPGVVVRALMARAARGTRPLTHLAMALSFPSQTCRVFVPSLPGAVIRALMARAARGTRPLTRCAMALSFPSQTYRVFVPSLPGAAVRANERGRRPWRGLRGCAQSERVGVYLPHDGEDG